MTAFDVSTPNAVPQRKSRRISSMEAHREVPARLHPDPPGTARAFAGWYRCANPFRIGGQCSIPPPCKNPGQPKWFDQHPMLMSIEDGTNSRSWRAVRLRPGLGRILGCAWHGPGHGRPFGAGARPGGRRRLSQGLSDVGDHVARIAVRRSLPPHRPQRGPCALRRRAATRAASALRRSPCAAGCPSHPSACRRTAPATARPRRSGPLTGGRSPGRPAPPAGTCPTWSRR